MRVIPRVSWWIFSAGRSSQTEFRGFDPTPSLPNIGNQRVYALTMGRMPKDMRQLMAQAQQMQQQMQESQDRLATRTYEATAGGGVVKATVTGAGDLVSVWFDPTVLDTEDPEMAGDLVVAAVNQALAVAGEDAAKELGPLAGGTDVGGMLG